MGQSLKKLAPGLLSNSSYFKARALKIEGADELLSILSKEIEENIGAKERNEENKEKLIGPIIERCYKEYLGEEAIKKIQSADHDPQSSTNAPRLLKGDFFRAVSKTVEQINVSLNSTQFRLPDREKLKEVYDGHLLHKDKEEPLKKDEFKKILQEVIIHSGFTGFGSKDTFLFIFGIPLITWFVKQQVAPKSVPNNVFIPVVTSASVYLLAKLNKI